MTHAYLGLAAFDLTATAIGFALLYGLRVIRLSPGALLFLGLAFFAGWALLGIGLSFAAMAGLDPDLPAVFVVAAVLIAVCIAARRIAPPFEPRRAPRSASALARSAALAGGAIVLLTLSVGLLEAVRTRADMTWDAWQFWLPKAEAIYYFHGLDTGLSGFTTYGNPEYPPLAPVMNAVGFHFMGSIHPAVLPLQQCLLLVAFASSVAVLLRRVPGWILYPSLAMVVLAPQVFGEMFSILPDQTLAYLLAVAVVTGILWLDERQKAWLVLTTVFLSAAALTKAEGVLLSGLLAVVLIATDAAVRRRGARPSLVLLLGPLAIVPWKIWLATHEQPTSATVYSWTDLLRPGYLGGRIDRFTGAMHYMIDLLGNANLWSPVLPLTLAALIVLAPTLRELSAVVAAWLLIAFFGLATVYWIGTPDLYWYLSSSADRVVTNLPLVAGAALPLLLAIAIERDRARGRDSDRADGAVR